MMNNENTFRATQIPVTYADLEAIEQQYGFTLPEDYKQLILRNNGGRPERRTFVQIAPNGERIERDISEFKPVKNGHYTLEDSLRVLRAELHDNLVPFAVEGGGDLFCLSVGPEDYGSVYYISHEFYKPPKKKEMSQPRRYGKGVHFLASSFTEFMNELVHIEYVDDEDDED